MSLRRTKSAIISCDGSFHHYNNENYLSEKAGVNLSFLLRAKIGDVNPVSSEKLHDFVIIYPSRGLYTGLTCVFQSHRKCWWAGGVAFYLQHNSYHAHVKLVIHFIWYIF